MKMEKNHYSNFVIQDLKTIKKCSIKQLLDLVNSVLTDEEKIRPVGARLYETTLKDGTRIRGSLTCLLYIRLSELWKEIEW